MTKEKKFAELSLEELNDYCKRLEEELSAARWFLRMKTFKKIESRIKDDKSSD